MRPSGQTLPEPLSLVTEVLSSGTQRQPLPVGAGQPRAAALSPPAKLNIRLADVIRHPQ